MPVEFTKSQVRVSKQSHTTPVLITQSRLHVSALWVNIRLFINIVTEQIIYCVKKEIITYTLYFAYNRQCTYNVTLRRVRESLLQWKSNKYYILDCVCACVRACMWVPGRVCVCMRISACSLANPACNAYAPYCDVIRGLPLEFTTFFWIISKTVPFKKKGIQHKMCVCSFSTHFV